jgi:hypothetical protein
MPETAHGRRQGHRGQHMRIVKISRSLLHRERDALPVDHNMALRARFAAIRQIRPGRRAPFGAGTENESIQARLQSILSESPSLSNSSWWSLCHTPRLFQSRNLRQQVTPEPQPIWEVEIRIPIGRTKVYFCLRRSVDDLGDTYTVFLTSILSVCLLSATFSWIRPAKIWQIDFFHPSSPLPEQGHK